jgi:surface antigen
MPPHVHGRRGRRGVGWVLSVATALLFVGLAAPSHATGDDYPYRGLGQCPLVPLPKPAKPAHHGQASPGQAGHAGHGPHTKPGDHGKPDTTSAPPVTPPRTCAKNIWYYNGSYGDPWGFALRNCTSFVAWRLRETNGMSDFVNDMDGESWGNADTWDQTARSLGYLVDDVPAVGAVAQTDAGRVGHVAWVESVGDGTVTVEEYNYEVAGGYDVRTVPTSEFRYLHLDDLSPAPYLGSTRSAATAVDASGDTWTARTDAAGDLTVRDPLGQVRSLGVPGSWSPSAAPSIAADPDGQVWVAAVSRSGAVLTSHAASAATPRWSDPREVGDGGWSTTATPSMAVDGAGRVHVIAVTDNGTLVDRHTTDRPGHWSLPARMGVPGSWSTQAAPAVATDPSGRLWLAAVTRSGGLLLRHTDTQGRWTAFHSVDPHAWSTTSTPALAPTRDGRLWLAAVTSGGNLVVRTTGGGAGRWHQVSQLPGQWSPYSSPALTEDGTGRVWLAAVKETGRLVVHSTDSDGKRWRRAPHVARLFGHVLRSDPTTSAVFGVTSSGQALLGATAEDGSVPWRRIGGPPLTASTGGARPGGFSLLLYA